MRSLSKGAGGTSPVSGAQVPETSVQQPRGELRAREASPLCDAGTDLRRPRSRWEEARGSRAREGERWDIAENQAGRLSLECEMQSNQGFKEEKGLMKMENHWTQGE